MTEYDRRQPKLQPKDPERWSEHLKDVPLKASHELFGDIVTESPGWFTIARHPAYFSLAYSCLVAS
ncbi:MAG TPA: hypothetical protein VGC53_15100, partial [Vicinamibacteria bacterium]